jgi:NTE family protein
MAKVRDNDSRKPETVLVMQGGGSLGAYECGVYKALSKHGKKFDIVAGTSIEKKYIIGWIKCELI